MLRGDRLKVKELIERKLERKLKRKEIALCRWIVEAVDLPYAPFTYGLTVSIAVEMGQWGESTLYFVFDFDPHPVEVVQGEDKRAADYIVQAIEEKLDNHIKGC